jgi:hypothetical protein
MPNLAQVLSDLQEQKKAALETRDHPANFDMSTHCKQYLTGLAEGLERSIAALSA